ncbi:hypothetical protein C7K38_01700 [Tetragenococcus osmophilus]|uniref:Uncharacterized protein n=1 Tax=Tetragenococcus osmophilus TaxID=526944 RepID=A0AA38CZD8_9ENTE|nr:transcriptional regulator GutM [Tetragenococcus osmophilus]GMA52704.1 hypothetical protein GCM10025857_40610 [Alicyclobacillus contaminans]AYW47197.1 hypothetical protein C7K38_01700 [Tetragenococcus osmophilus]GMA55277.1 hypothetical protein GCM10025857_66340 [Alicyclobacillus contaminans]GMA73285.1 hypothetical protein GCM10025885_23340 [Tetragenococcus osmophilus]GMA73347.1 hypothetical protein GCM10025885_23960 [Tetragenococcus osmophilus]
MVEIAILGSTIVLLQTIFSFYQIKYYHHFIKGIVKSYEQKTNYHLDTEIVKKTFGSMVIVVVTDGNNTIIESYYYRGFTVFSKFQDFNEIKGKQLDKCLLDHLENKQLSLKQKAIKQLINKKLKAVAF